MSEQKRNIEQARRRKQLKRTVFWIGGFFLAAAAVYGLGKLANRPQGPQPGEFFAAQSRDHIAVGAEHPAYNSNPPTGGWHYETPAQTGIYNVQLADEQLLHNLEHGHVWISYRSDLANDQIEQLAKIAKSYGYKIIMTRRDANPTAIAVSAWEHLLKLDQVDENLIREFVRAYRGKGPESVPDFGFDDFRGKPTPTPLNSM